MSETRLLFFLYNNNDNIIFLLLLFLYCHSISDFRNTSESDVARAKMSLEMTESLLHEKRQRLSQIQESREKGSKFGSILRSVTGEPKGIT